jgi:hypothetical protein
METLRNRLSACLLLFLFLAGTAYAQVEEVTGNSEIKEFNTSTGTENNIVSLAKEINLENSSDEQKLEAIYDWICQNIAYDIQQLKLPPGNMNETQLAEEALSTRKAICQGYTALFDALCKSSNIQSFIIRGYVKLNGIILDIPHAWIGAFSNNRWELYDPTWGAGYVDNEKFTPHFTRDFFKINPGTSITSRMPFDPAWQLLTHPVSHFEFISGIKDTGNENTFYFNDSISLFFAADTLGRLEQESRRVLKAGIANNLISEYYQYLNKLSKNILENIEIDRKNAFVKKANEAVDYYNQAVASYNRYVSSKNVQFRSPKKSDEDVKSMIREADSLLQHAELIMRKLSSEEQDLRQIVRDISKNNSELRKAVNSEIAFVEKYIKTPTSLRMNLFRVPVNKKKK